MYVPVLDMVVLANKLMIQDCTGKKKKKERHMLFADGCTVLFYLA